MDRPVFDHEGPWTEDAYRTLGPAPGAGGGRVELVDGALLVGPGTTPGRSRAVARIREAVGAALPDGLRVLGPVPLRLGRDCVLVPDLVVARDGDEAADGILDAADTLLVVEVVGADHGAADRSFKPQLYARSHIPYSLLVDHDAPFAVANMIISGRYHEYARAAGGESLRIEEPFALSVDLDALRDVAARQAGVPAGG